MANKGMLTTVVVAGGALAAYLFWRNQQGQGSNVIPSAAPSSGGGGGVAAAPQSGAGTAASGSPSAGPTTGGAYVSQIPGYAQVEGDKAATYQAILAEIAYLQRVWWEDYKISSVSGQWTDRQKAAHARANELRAKLAALGLAIPEWAAG